MVKSVYGYMSGIGTKPSPVIGNGAADITSKAFCIIGNPVEHSLSPLMQNAAFRHVNLNYSYIAFKVPAEELQAAVESMRKIRIATATNRPMIGVGKEVVTQ